MNSKFLSNRVGSGTTLCALRMFYEPGDVEGVVVVAGNQVDRAVETLADGKIPGRFSHRIAESERAIIHAPNLARSAAWSYKAANRPCLAIIVRKCDEHSATGTRFACGIDDTQLGNGRVENQTAMLDGFSSERYKQERTFAEP